MRLRLLAVLSATVLAIAPAAAGCGSSATPADAAPPAVDAAPIDSGTSPADAAAPPRDAASPDAAPPPDAATDAAPDAPIVDAAPDAPVADAAPDAADAAPDADAGPLMCTYVAASAAAPVGLAYTFSGGAFQSFGCAPIDPTYWMSGSGMSATVTFTAPQARPSFRVWGMNTDDTASVKVNGVAYPLDAASASFSAKVVCGISPGPDGVAFVGGALAGANTPAQGNYSYQDITLETTGVTSITVTGLTGAGWGFAGASHDCR